MASAEDKGLIAARFGGLQFGLGVFGIASQRDAAKASREALRLERRVAELQTAQNIKSGIREARIAAANVEAQAQATGTIGSSTARQVQASIKSQLGTQIGTIAVRSELEDRILSERQKALDAQSDAATASGVSGIIGKATSTLTGGLF